MLNYDLLNKNQNFNQIIKTTSLKHINKSGIEFFSNDTFKNLSRACLV